MKKLLITFVCVCMFLNSLICNVTYAQDDIEQVVDYETLNFIEKIGLINYSVDSYEKHVTREMFALYIARALNIDEYVSSDVRYFYDMENSGFATSAVNALVDRKIVTVGEDKRFRPSDYITCAEACKMLISMLGYDVYAEKTGGFPIGYLTVAKKLNIIDDTLLGNSKFTVSQVAQMLYCAVQVGLPDINAMRVLEDSVYSEHAFASNNTILSVYHNIYFKKGTVKSIYGGSMSLEGKFALKNELIIDDIRMSLPPSINSNDLLSSYVKIFYYSDRKGEEMPEIIYIKSNEGKAQDLIIDISNFVRITNSQIEYYQTNSSAKIKKINITNPILLYNNYRLTQNESNIIKNLNKGYIQIKDSNNDGDYDTVNFRDYKNFIPVNMDSENKILYNKLNSLDRKKITDYECVKIFDNKNNEYEFSDIKENSVLSIAETEDNYCIEILCSTDEINGIIDSVNSDDSLLINSKKYVFDKSYYKEEFSKSKKNVVGKKFYIKLDAFGNICYMSVDAESDMLGAFIIEGKLIDKAFSQQLHLQVLTEDGIKQFRCADKLVVDGKNFKQDYKEAVKAMNVNNSDATYVEQGLIRYRLNSENEISEIDTLNLNEKYESDQNSLTSVFEEVGKERWFNYNRIDVRAVMDGDTEVFFIPKDAVAFDKNDYFVSSYNKVMISDERYYVDAYYVNTSNGFVDYAVCKYDYSQLPKNSTTRSPVVMVKDFYSKLNSENECVNVLTGFENGTAVEYEIPNDIDLSGVETGDLIQFTSYYANGKIASGSKTGSKSGYIMIYDCSNEKPDWKENTANPNLYSMGYSTTNYYRAAFQLSFGYIVKVSGNIAYWGYNDDGKIDEGAVVNVPVIVCDKNERGENMVYAGNVNDLLPYESVGVDRSKIIYFTKAGSPVVMYSYR